MLQRISFAMLVASALLFSGCATTQNNHDPIEPVNRVTDGFNEGLDRITMKPLAQGYVAITNKPLRTAISNFYDNITYPNTILNDFLQGKGKQGVQDFGRFIINTTIGIGGLADVATGIGLEKHEEDFGQTLAVWGFSQGAYVVYPFFGPNSVRKTPDFITSTLTDGLFWASLYVAPAVSIPLAVMKYVDKRSRLLDASDMRDDMALDPYVFTREAWRQHREYLIYDGNPPAPASNGEDDWGDDEEWSDEPTFDNPPADDNSAAPQDGTSEQNSATEASDSSAPDAESTPPATTEEPEQPRFRPRIRMEDD